MSRMNAGLILGGQPVSIANAFAGGQLAGQKAQEGQQRNALNAFLQESGADVAAGNPEAVNALATMGVDGLGMATEIQAREEQRANARERLGILRANAARDAEEHVLKLDALKRDEVEKDIRDNLLQVASVYETGDEQAYLAEFERMGIDPVPMDQFPFEAAKYEGMLDALEKAREFQAEPEATAPLSGPGKVQADINAGLLPADTALRSSGVTVNTGDQAARVGTIPKGYQLTGDGSTESPYVFAAIPGGPADTTANEAAAQEQTQRSGGIVLEDIGRVRDTVQGSEFFGGNTATGLAGSVLKQIPGTNAYDVRSLMDTIGANVGFDRLQQMRDASPTGGALGAISERELSLLTAVLGNLEQSQSEEQFLENLNRLERVYKDIVHGPGGEPAVPEGDDLTPEEKSFLGL